MQEAAQVDVEAFGAGEEVTGMPSNPLLISVMSSNRMIDFCLRKTLHI